MSTLSAPRDEEIARLRVPPHSIEAEQSVLGGLLIDNSAWDRAADLVSDHDFYRLEHRLIFQAVGKLITAGKPADVITVHEELSLLGKSRGLRRTRIPERAGPGRPQRRQSAPLRRDRARARRAQKARQRQR
jgi:replicative DNA helicase